MLDDGDEWIVYRVRRGVNCAPMRAWRVYVKEYPEKLEAMKRIIVADKLTKTQARQFVALTKESEE